MSDTLVAGHDSPPASLLPLPQVKGAFPVVDGILFADLLPAVPAQAMTEAIRKYREPFVGITDDGTPRRGLYALADTGDRPTVITDAARAYLGSLAPFQLTIAQLPMDSPDWRLWTNALPTWSPKGMRLERLTEAQRALALAIIESSLSTEGAGLVRSAMKLNGALGELIDDYRDTLTEFTYWFTIFGDPASGEPWGWQLMGHHVDLHCIFVGSQIVLAPIFLGAEPAACRACTPNVSSSKWPGISTPPALPGAAGTTTSPPSTTGSTLPCCWSSTTTTRACSYPTPNPNASTSTPSSASPTATTTAWTSSRSTTPCTMRPRRPRRPRRQMPTDGPSGDRAQVVKIGLLSRDRRRRPRAAAGVACERRRS